MRFWKAPVKIVWEVYDEGSGVYQSLGGLR